jgi:excisionase family DNA binding protein
MAEKRLLTVEEFASYSGKRPGTIRNMIAQGTIPVRFVKQGRQVLFDRRDVDKWIDSLPRYGGGADNPGSKSERRGKK